MNPLILPALSWIVPILSFYKADLCIKLPAKVVKPLNNILKLAYLSLLDCFMLNVAFKSLQNLYSLQKVHYCYKWMLIVLETFLIVINFYFSFKNFWRYKKRNTHINVFVYPLNKETILFTTHCDVILCCVDFFILLNIFKFFFSFFFLFLSPSPFLYFLSLILSFLSSFLPFFLTFHSFLFISPFFKNFFSIFFPFLCI